MSTVIGLLLALIAAVTGIDRDVDPELTAIAEQRAVEITTDFSHAGLQTSEVLAWSTAQDLDVAVERIVMRWQESPDHWAILANPDLTRIGCGYALGVDPDQGEPAVFVACALAAGPEPEPVTPLLPNTAMAAP